MLKEFRTSLIASIGAIVVASAIAFAAAIPSLPSTPALNEPSQEIATLNALINQLNGQLGYAPAQIISIGANCSNGAGGATPQVCNGQHGQVTFTGVGTLVTGAVTTLVVTDSLVAANSQCFAQVATGGAAGSAPYIADATATAGSLSLILANGGTTATGAAATFAININCM